MAGITIDELQVLVTANTEQLKKSFSNIESQLGGVQKSTSGFSAKSAALFGVIAGAAQAVASKGIAMISSSIDGAVRRVDTLNNAPKVLQNLGFTAEESALAIRKIDKGVQGLPTSLDEIASSLVAIASSSGLSIEKATDLTVAFNNMALAGGKGPAEAQRALVQFTQALGRGKFQAQDFNTLMEVMPAQLTQVAKTLLGASSNSGKLRDALTSGEVSMEQFNNAIISLNSKGGKNFASFADQAKDATAGIATGWGLVQTAITRGVAKIIETVGSGNIVKAFGVLRTAVDAFFTSISGVISFISQHADIFGPIAVGILSVVAGLAAYHVAVGIATTAQAIFNAVLSANPIGLIVIAIAALVAGLTYFFTQTELGRLVVEKFNQALSAVVNVFMTYLWPTLKQIGAFVGGVFKEAWDKVSKAIKDLMAVLKPFEPLLKVIGAVIAVAIIAPLLVVVATVVAVIAIFTALATGIAWAVSKIAELISGMVNFFKNAWSSIKATYSGAAGWFSGIFNAVISVIRSIFGAFGGVASNAWNAIKAPFSGAWNWFKGVFNRVKSAITGISWGSVGTNIIQGIGNGIAGMAGWLAEKAKAAVGGAKDKLKSFLGIHSPSRVMRDEVGKMLGLGLAEGIDASARAVTQSMTELSRLSTGSFDTSMNIKSNVADGVRSQSSRPITIINQLNGKEISRTVIDDINDMSFLSGASVLNI